LYARRRHHLCTEKNERNGKIAAATLAARQRGISLIESMLATVIAGILTTAAVPAMSNVITQQRLGA